MTTHHNASGLKTFDFGGQISHFLPPPTHTSLVAFPTLFAAQISAGTFEVVNVEFNEDDLIKQLPSGPVHMISIGGWSFSRADGVFV